MNKVILMGRLTRDPEIRYTQGEDPMAIARFTLAIDRRIRKEGQQNADFVSCVSFKKQAEFAEKYLKQGTKVAIVGHLQTGSYEKDGQKHYTTDVVIDEQEFAESKGGSGNSEESQEEPKKGGDYMNIPEGIENDLPFK